jgi:hypothetical protein
MTADNSPIPSEEVIFYIDLTTEYLEKETLIKDIRSFMQEKNEFGDSNYGLVIFQENDNPITIYGKNDLDSITQTLDLYWDTRPKDQSYIENGLFEILSYVFCESRNNKKVYRIIVISDTPSTRQEEYHQALYDLIVKLKNFSTIIDIIRVGDNESYDDDIKLKVISSETHGGTFYCQKMRFYDVFGSLVKNKTEFNIVQEHGGNLILEQDKTFYEHLAVELITLDSEDEMNCSICQLEVCPICGAFSDEIRKCYNCGAKFHGCCIAKYSIIKNIGFKHIFRCPQCETLLKLDEDYVNLVYEEEYEELHKIENAQDLKLEHQIIPITEEDKMKELFIEEEIQHEAPFEESPEIVETKEQFIYVEEEFEEEISLDQITFNSQDLPPPPSLPTKEKTMALKKVKAPPLSTPSTPKKLKAPPSTSQPEPQPIPDIEITPSEPKLQPIPDIEIIPSEPKPPSILEIKAPPSPPPAKKIRIGGYFGQEVVVNSINKTKKLKVVSSVNTTIIKEDLSITSLKPPPKKRVSLKFCKICGTTTNIPKCPNCGAFID